MAKTRKIISIEEKIETAQKKVVTAKEKYDAALAELRALYDKRDAMRKDELMNAFVKSNRTYEEVMDYLQAGISDEGKEKPAHKRRGRKSKNDI